MPHQRSCGFSAEPRETLFRTNNRNVIDQRHDTLLFISSCSTQKNTGIEFTQRKPREIDLPAAQPGQKGPCRTVYPPGGFTHQVNADPCIKYLDSATGKVHLFQQSVNQCPGRIRLFPTNQVNCTCTCFCLSFIQGRAASDVCDLPLSWSTGISDMRFSVQSDSVAYHGSRVLDIQA